MDISVLRAEADPRTFRPFDLVLVNGATFHVPFHDSLYIPPERPGQRRRAWYVHLHHEEDGTGRTIDPAMIAQEVHRENGHNGHHKS